MGRILSLKAFEIKVSYSDAVKVKLWDDSLPKTVYDTQYAALCIMQTPALLALTPNVDWNLELSKLNDKHKCCDEAIRYLQYEDSVYRTIEIMIKLGQPTDVIRELLSN